jgi:adenine phosphoribosyltransferase
VRAGKSVDLKRLIRTIPDYPKPGILFRDITTLLLDPQGLRGAVDELMLPFVNSSIDLVAGI